MAYRNRGLVHQRRGDYGRALLEFDQAVRADPRYASARYSRGEAHLQMRNYELAVRDYDAAVELNPDGAHGHYRACWVRAAYLVRELNRALRECEEAIRLDSADVWHFGALGMALFRQRRFAEAWQAYDRAVQINANCAHCLYGRALAAMNAGRREEGAEDLRRALVLDPEAGDTYLGYGIRAPGAGSREI